MHLLTVVNRNDPGLELWTHTARLAGHTPHVLWAPANAKLGHASKWFGQKFVTLDAHLQTLPANDLCVVTDGFDVALLDGPQTLTQKIQGKVRADQLLFAAELFENPDKGNPYDLSRKPFPFLNSGVYAGTCAVIRKALATALSHPDVLQLDDQRFFTQLFFSQPDLIVLDHTAEVFVCLAGFSDFQLTDRRLVVTPTQTRPSVLHFQGFYKNTLGVLPALFPQDAKVLHLARQIHRMPNAFTPIADFIADVGRPLPFGDTAPFAVGLVAILAVALATAWDMKQNACCATIQ